MKHTKKLLAAVMAFAMVSVIAPMSAFADTEIKRDSSNHSGEMKATYDVKAKYTVTIPAGVTLDSENSVTANFKASEVIIGSGQKIKVTLTDASNTESGATFHAQTEKGDSTATYTIGKGTATTGVSVGDTVAEFTENGTQSITFSKAEGATYAGRHTETLTFGISTPGALADQVLTNGSVTQITFNYYGARTVSFTYNNGEFSVTKKPDDLDPAMPYVLKEESGKLIFNVQSDTPGYIDLTATIDLSKLTYSVSNNSIWTISYNGGMSVNGTDVTLTAES